MKSLYTSKYYILPALSFLLFFMSHNGHSHADQIYVSHQSTNDDSNRLNFTSDSDRIINDPNFQGYDLLINNQDTDVHFETEIFLLLKKWVVAWQDSAGIKGNIEKYISFYSEDFYSGDLDKRGWEQDKINKNRVKKYIMVIIEDIFVTKRPNLNEAEVKFLQNYTSSNYSEKTFKALSLKKEGNTWKIVSERTL